MESVEEKNLKKELSKEKRINELKFKLEKTKKLREEFAFEFEHRLVVFFTTAFGVVAALFWQTAITDSIKAFIPVNGAWFYEIFVALLVTGIAVVAVFFVSKLSEHSKKIRGRKKK